MRIAARIGRHHAGLRSRAVANLHVGSFLQPRRSPVQISRKVRRTPSCRWQPSNEQHWKPDFAPTHRRCSQQFHRNENRAKNGDADSDDDCYTTIGAEPLFGILRCNSHNDIPTWNYSPPAAIPRRAKRRVANRQMPQAYPPQRGSVQCVGQCSTLDERSTGKPRRSEVRFRCRRTQTDGKIAANTSG